MLTGFVLKVARRLAAGIATQDNWVSKSIVCVQGSVPFEFASICQLLVKVIMVLSETRVRLSTKHPHGVKTSSYTNNMRATRSTNGQAYSPSVSVTNTKVETVYGISITSLTRATFLGACLQVLVRIGQIGKDLKNAQNLRWTRFGFAKRQRS